MEQEQTDQKLGEHTDPLEEAQELIADYLATYGDADCRDPDHGTCHELVLALENLLSKITAKEESDSVAVNRMISRAYDEGHERGLADAQMKQDSRIVELEAFQEVITEKLSQLQDRVIAVENQKSSQSHFDSLKQEFRRELVGAMTIIKIVMKKHNIPVVSIEANELRDSMTDGSGYLLRHDDPITGTLTLKLRNE